MQTKPILLGFLNVSILVCAIPAFAQQVTVSSPHTAVSDSFFEHTGTSWGAHGKNWFFQFGPPGNPNGAAPQFGGFDPSAGANFGFGFGGGGFGGGFLGNFSQGSRRSFTSVTPSVTVPNGGTGMIMDTSVSPFVMGYIPIVGGFPIFAAPPMRPMVPPAPYIPPGPASGHPAVLQALQNVSRDRQVTKPDAVKPRAPDRDDDSFNLVGAGATSSTASASDAVSQRVAMSQVSSAGRPALGVAEARRLREAELNHQDSEARQFLERGRHAEEDGKLSLARTYYRMAVLRASPDLRQEAMKHLALLPAPDTHPGKGD